MLVMMMKDSIVVDGVEYVKKSSLVIEHNDKFEQFSDKVHANLHKAIAFLFSWENEPLSEQIAFSKEKLCLLDDSKAAMLIAKTYRAKEILRHYMNFDKSDTKVPKLDYATKNDKDNIFMSKYSLEFLIPALKIFKCISESVKVQIRNDYPVTISNDDFDFILAPRVEND